MAVSFDDQDYFRRCARKGKWTDSVEHIVEKCNLLYFGCDHQFSSDSPLTLAAENGHTRWCLRILNAFRKKHRRTAYTHELHNAIVGAARGGYSTCLQHLMDSDYHLLQGAKTLDRPKKFDQALKSGDFEFLQSFLKSSKFRRSGQYSRIHLLNLLVVYRCPPSCVKVLLDARVDTCEYGKNGLTPLMCAILAGNIECVKLLMVSPAVSIQEITSLYFKAYERTPLMFAACLKNSTPVLEILLQGHHPSDVNLSNRVGWRALTFACFYGNAEAVSLLLQAGAETDIFDMKGNSILIVAMKSGDKDFFKFLLSKVSPDYCKNTLRRTSERESLVKNPCYLELLLETCSFSADEAKDLEVFLWAAISVCSVQALKILLDKGADINCKDCRGMTPLHVSCCDSRKEAIVVVDFLIYKGAELNIQNADGETAIFQCIRNRDDYLLTVLIKKGADLHLTNSTGHTILSYALSMGMFDFVAIMTRSRKLFESEMWNWNLKSVYKNSILKYSENIYKSASVRVYNWLIQAKMFEWNLYTPFYLHFTRMAFAALYACRCPQMVTLAGTAISKQPLVIALALNNVDLARYLWINLYFYPEDLTTLRQDEKVRGYVTANESTELNSVLDCITKDVPSLQVLSFLTVSKAVSLAGPLWKRKERVDTLPVYDLFKQALKFDTHVARICPEHWDKLGHLAPGDFASKQKAVFPYGSCLSCCLFCDGLGVQPRILKKTLLGFRF